MAAETSSYHDLYARLRQSWSTDTSSKWQCAVTALVVQDILGGDILKTNVDGAWHFYNCLDGCRVDFTAEQFVSPIEYKDIVSNRDEAFNEVSISQYELLRSCVALYDRERIPALAQERFAARREEFIDLDRAARFNLIYQTNLWGAESSVSGVGSEIIATEKLRKELSDLLRSLNVRTLLDLPCGDFSWMAETDLDDIRYLGADIVPEIIEANLLKHSKASRAFRRMDIVEDPIPRHDVVLCRDCLVHFSFAQINRTIENIKRSRSKWLLTTTFPAIRHNRDIEDGDWRPLNLRVAPFLFPSPDTIINENCTEAGGDYSDKSLALWSIDSLPVP
ncbi:class I SAM-dependent methyltransferase [Bradyrhizobium sp. USDA 10063]